MEVKNDITMSLPKGYKQTAIGVIPEDWEVKEFSKMAELCKKKFVPNDQNIPCIEMEHINQQSGTINGFINSKLQKSTKNVFQTGDVLFGKLRPYLRKYWHADFDGVCSSEIWVFKPKNNITSDFLFRTIQTNKFIQIANVSTGSKMPRADWDFVSEFPFLVPPIQEQQKIAEILSTWDKAIETCQKTITQLNERNKGLAQQLLSGKKRVKGFENTAWEFVKFKDIYKPNKIKANENKYEILSVTKNGIVSQNEYFNRNVASESTHNYLVVEKGDFLVSGLNFWMGSYDVLQNFEIGMISPAYKVFRLKSGFEKEYFKHFVQSRQMRFAMISASVIGASIVRRNFDLEALYEYSFKIPSIEEQKEIAKILDAAVAELKLYEEKLQTLQQQKKGLMQQLLTGKVRTI